MGFFGLLALVYVVQTAVLPPDPATLHRYHITSATASLLGLSVALPYVVTWVIALIGYIRLRVYADTITDSPDGEAFKTIADGVLGLAVWLPLTAVVGAIVTRTYRNHPSLTAHLVQLNNYFNLTILFISLCVLYFGARKLMALVERPTYSWPRNASIVVFGVMAIAYIVIVFHDPARAHPTKDVAVGTYYSADWVIALTLVLPRLFVWYLGLQAAVMIYLYRENVSGHIYKEALNYLASGLGFVVVSTVALRYFASLPTKVNNLSLGFILLVVYLLIILIGVGYGLVARGAKQLKLIEDL